MGRVPSLPEGVSTHTSHEPQFIGQQDGIAADILQEDFREELSAFPQVERAYFCKVSVAGDDHAGAALCLVSSAGEDLAVIESLAGAIRKNLSQGFHIDILFLTATLESRLQAVCRPFYNRDSFEET